MLRITVTCVSLLAVTLVLAAGSVRSAVSNPDQDPAATGTGEAIAFAVDSVHSSMAFKVRHMGVANFIGRFNTIEGTYSFDPDNPTAGHFDIRIDAASIDTNSKERDTHLKKPEFFNTDEHPAITFKSSKVKKVSDDVWTVTGDLTLLGKSKPLTVEMKLIGMGETFQGYKSGFDTTFKFKRTDFGMDTYVKQGGLGDEIEVMLCLEGRRK